jgi:hypothetical protein
MDEQPIPSSEDGPNPHRDAFRTLAGACFTATNQLLAANAAAITPPAELFHFTTAAGLIGILTEGRIRASCAVALNDPSETRHAITVAREMLSGASSQFRRHLDRYLADDLKRRAGDRDIYVVSFCRRIDKSFHWLHYGKEGQGLAISFDPANVQHPQFSLVPVLYDRALQELLLGAVIDAVEDALTTTAPMIAQQFQSELPDMAASVCDGVIRTMAPQMKHPAFIDENEWRLVAIDDTRITGGNFPLRVEFRAVGARVVPYVNFPLPTPLPIREVVLGYSSPMTFDIEPVFTLLRSFLGGSARVRRSDVPAR